MKIRELSGGDRSEVVALWKAAGLTRPWSDPGADFDRAVAGPTSCVLGAASRTGLAATVMVDHDGHRGWVYYLAAIPMARRSGLGRQMMRAAEDWLRARVVAKLNLMVRHDNTAALGFYERVGYEPSEVTVMARWLGRAAVDSTVPTDHRS